MISILNSLKILTKPKYAIIKTFKISRRFYASSPPVNQEKMVSNNSTFQQINKKPPTKLKNPRTLIVACPPMKSNVNLSAIARVSSCMGVSRLVLCGTSKLWPHIARQGFDLESPSEELDTSEFHIHGMDITIHRTLGPVLKRIKADGYKLVALEQTTNSTPIFDFDWPSHTVLVAGHESHGISPEILEMCDHSVEIPMYGLPFSLNVSHATAIALSSYCKQYPS